MANNLFKNFSTLFFLSGVLVFSAGIYLNTYGNYLFSQGELQSGGFVSSAGTLINSLFLIGLATIIMVSLGLFPQSKMFILEGGKNSLMNSSIGLVVGIIFWSITLAVTEGTSIKSIISLSPQAAIYSTAIGLLPSFWNNFITNISIPIAEELVFAVALPLLLFVFLESLTSYIQILKNYMVRLMIVIIITALAFSSLHVSQGDATNFILSSIIFRIIIIGLVYSEKKYDFIPLIDLSLFFAIGIHITNNIIGTGGWVKFIQILISSYSLGIFEMVVSIVTIIWFTTAFYLTYLWIRKTVRV